jgi:hemerythrin-like domain-containing protein
VNVRSVEILRREHALIGLVLARLEDAVQAVQSGGAVDEVLLRKAFEFAQGFVHGVHQAKEEIFSRRAVDRGLAGGDADGCSDVLDFAGAAVRALADALEGDAAARRLLSENAKAYVGLVRSHIIGRKAIFKTAEGTLSEEDDRLLVSLFSAAEERFGTDVAERYARLAEEIRQEAGALAARNAQNLPTHAPEGYHGRRGG